MPDELVQRVCQVQLEIFQQSENTAEYTVSSPIILKNGCHRLSNVNVKMARQ